MASDILDRVAMVISDIGAPALTAVTANVLISDRFNTPQEAGAVNGKSYWWMLEEGTDYEIFEGTWTLSGTKITRGVVWQSKINGVHGTDRMALGGNATLRSITPAEALNYIRFDTAQSLSSTQKDQASVNIGTVRAIRTQKFTSSGTYTPDPNLIYCTIECIGGGGGGGGAASTTSGTVNGAGGGGAGGLSKKTASAADIATSKPVVIGVGAAGGVGYADGSTGGDTSVGSLCIGKGGSGGFGAAPGGAGAPGPGGVLGTGDQTFIGSAGIPGPRSLSAAVIFAQVSGANSPYGTGGVLTAGSNGANATGYGAGGGGASSYSGGAAQNGGAGSPGYVCITEYCSK